MNVGELFVSLGFDVDDASLKDFNAKIVEGRNEILTMSAAATGAVYALNAMFESSAHNALQLKNFTEQTGYSAEALQKWQAVIHETNPAVGLEEAANGYKKLAQTLIDIRQGKGNSGALAMLGVTYDPNMTPEKALAQVAAHLKETIAQNGIGFVTDKLNSIGIGAGAIDALKLYGDNLAEFQRMGGAAVVTQEDIDRNIEYAKTIAQIDVEWQKFKMEFTAEWAGTAINAIKYADDTLKEFGKNVTAVFDYVRSHQDVFGPIETALAALAGFWGIATFPITAAFAGLAFAINDVGRALRGLPSLTGGVYDNFVPGLKMLKNDPAQFADNLGAAIDSVMRNKLGINIPYAPGYGPNGKIDDADKKSGAAGGTINQTNNIHISQKMTREEIDNFIHDKVDEAHTQLNLGAAY